jgi:hypothetical protein
MANQYALCGLDVFKDYINETTTTNDTFNQNLVNRASRQIESYTKRKLRAREYTEYYDGSGSSGELFLNQYPIISTTSTIELYDDIDRGFGSSYKFASDDFVIYSDEGFIELLSDSSLGNTFQNGTQNIKVVYTAGYDEFVIVSGVNDALDFNEDGSTELNATLDADTYTGSTLATEIDTQLEDTGTASAYTVTYNNVTGKFTLTKASGTFELMWDGTNNATTCGDLIGFVITAEDSGALTYTSDFSRPGVPEDLELACIMLAAHYKLASKKGEARQGLSSKTAGQPGSGSINYKEEQIPGEVKEILQPYVRRNL